MITQLTDEFITTLQEEKNRFENAKKITSYDGWVVYHCMDAYDPDCTSAVPIARTLSLGLWNILFYWYCCNTRWCPFPTYMWLVNKDFKIPDDSSPYLSLDGCEDYSTCLIITDKDREDFYDTYYREYT